MVFPSPPPVVSRKRCLVDRDTEVGEIDASEGSYTLRVGVGVQQQQQQHPMHPFKYFRSSASSPTGSKNCIMPFEGVRPVGPYKRSHFIAEEEDQGLYGSEAVDEGPQEGPLSKRSKAELDLYTRDGTDLDNSQGCSHSLDSTMAPPLLKIPARDGINSCTVVSDEDVDYQSFNSFLRDLHLRRGARHSRRAQGLVSSATLAEVNSDVEALNAQEQDVRTGDQHHFSVLASPIISVLRDLPRTRRCDFEYRRRLEMEEEIARNQQESRKDLMMLENDAQNQSTLPKAFLMSFGPQR